MCVCVYVRRSWLLVCIRAQMHSCGNYKGRARQAGGQSPLGSSLQPLSAQTRLINPSLGDRYVYTHTRRHVYKGRRLLAEKNAPIICTFGNQEKSLSFGRNLKGIDVSKGLGKTVPLRTESLRAFPRPRRDCRCINGHPSTGEPQTRLTLAGAGA